MREQPTASRIPVTIAADAVPTHDCRIHLPNGIVLGLSGAFEPAQLTQKLLQLTP